MQAENESLSFTNKMVDGGMHLNLQNIRVKKTKHKIGTGKIN